jgi:phosphoribosylglycinamide formyltransferase-1
MYRLAVFISGGGSLLPAVYAAVRGEDYPACIDCVVSDRPDISGLERAKEAGIETMCVDRAEYDNGRGTGLSDALLEFVENRADLIVLAGFLSILRGRILEVFAGRIINTHPALLPKHGGKGMYGMRVHRAVIESGDWVSGCTVHYVTAGIDRGPIILQRQFDVEPGDTEDTLRRKVHEIEGPTLAEAVRMAIARLERKE